MATQIPSELESFQRFLSERLEDGTVELSPEESVEAFRAYQRDLERFREDLAPALARSLRGEPEPLDIDDSKARGRRRLEDVGITD